MITVILLVIVILIIMSLVFLVDTKCSKKCDNVEHLDADENMCFDNNTIVQCSGDPSITQDRGRFITVSDSNKDIMHTCSKPISISCKLLGANNHCGYFNCTNIPKGSDISKLDPRYGTFTN